MTDKEEIIIDGVDVSGCNYAILPKNKCPAKIMPYAKETSCIACKEHNTKLNFCKNNPNCYFKQLKRKEQECEEHRRNAESYCKSYQYSCAVNGKMTDKALKYKQALDEIAEHYGKVIKNLTTYDDRHDANISIKALHNISDIINKAKDDNNDR